MSLIYVKLWDIPCTVVIIATRQPETHRRHVGALIPVRLFPARAPRNPASGTTVTKKVLLCPIHDRDHSFMKVNIFDRRCSVKRSLIAIKIVNEHLRWWKLLALFDHLTSPHTCRFTIVAALHLR